MPQVVHDFEHLGVNNDYLMRCCHVLATIYNDKSPAEMHHLAAAFHLLQQDEYKFNAAMPPKSKVRAALRMSRCGRRCRSTRPRCALVRAAAGSLPFVHRWHLF